MGQELSPKENELYRRTHEVLHYIWDPVGVSDEPRARDEYQGYLPQFFHKSSIKQHHKLLLTIELK